MKRIRNPRYAPEFLERKLCPSGFAGDLGASALFSTPDPAASQNVTPSADPSASGAAALTTASSDTSLADPNAINGNINDPALIGPSVTDPESDDSSDDDPGSDDASGDNPVVPVPDPNYPPADPGDPPYVPLPPVPVGPAGPAF